MIIELIGYRANLLVMRPSLSSSGLADDLPCEVDPRGLSVPEQVSIEYNQLIIES